MLSKEKILQVVAANQPEFVPLPEMNHGCLIEYSDLCAQFKTASENVGATVQRINDIQVLKEELKKEAEAGRFIINTIAGLGTINKQATLLPAARLNQLEKVYIKGTIGVAENAAVWVPESNMLNRLLPFIAEHLVLLLEKKNIVTTLHEAYQRIDISTAGFGVFIAGPSKTADIEQSLVTGAHGARSTKVYILE